MNKKECLKWFHRGVEHGRKLVLENLLNALGLDPHDFKSMPVSEIESEKWFEHFRSLDILREASKKPQIIHIGPTEERIDPQDVAESQK